jgi:hypothetical protein
MLFDLPCRLPDSIDSDPLHFLPDFATTPSSNNKTTLSDFVEEFGVPGVIAGTPVWVVDCAACQAYKVSVMTP